MILFLAALLPCVVWEGSASTVSYLTTAHIEYICVAGKSAADRRPTGNLRVEEIDPASYIKIPAPSISFRGDVASPTRAPWVTLNGWRFLRDPERKFYSVASGDAAAMAAAEAFAYGVQAAIKTDDAGLMPLGQMLDFLRSAGDTQLPPRVNIGFLDDGSYESGEFMNLLVRRNLLFRVVARPDLGLDMNVKLGQQEYPRSDASNPKLLSENVRAQLTDQKRVLRIYGTEVVVGRLLADGNAARLYLINYAGPKYPVPGVRVRVLGDYHSQRATQAGILATKLQDVSVRDGATEFTIPSLVTFAVIDLTK